MSNCELWLLYLLCPVRQIGWAIKLIDSGRKQVRDYSYKSPTRMLMAGSTTSYMSSIWRGIFLRVKVLFECSTCESEYPTTRSQNMVEKRRAS